MPYMAPPRAKPKKQMNPIWRGLGLIFLLVFTVGSYVLTGWLLELNAANAWIPIPREWNPLYVRIAATLILSGLGFSILNMIYGLIVGPPVGPLDVRGSKR